MIDYNEKAMDRKLRLFSPPDRAPNFFPGQNQDNLRASYSSNPPKTTSDRPPMTADAISSFLRPKKAAPNPAKNTAKHLQMVRQICQENTVKKAPGDRIKPQTLPRIPKLSDADIQELCQKYSNRERFTDQGDYVEVP